MLKTLLLLLASVTSVETGQPHPLLQRLAQEHAEQQAKAGVMGHEGWERRFQEASKLGAVGEVAAVSCGDAGADAIYNAWRASPAHWRILNHPCKYYGFAVVKSGNYWYASGIIVW